MQNTKLKLYTGKICLFLVFNHMTDHNIPLSNQPSSFWVNIVTEEEHLK